MPLLADAAMRIVSLATVCLLLTACGSPVNQANFDKIKTGMSVEQVQAILGNPTESSTASFGELSGGAATWKNDDIVITVQFVNNKVQFKQFAKNDASDK